MHGTLTAMKIGIISDTHENMPMIRNAVELFNREEVAVVLHGGDIISPITAKEFDDLKAPLIGVFGNNDGDRLFLTERFKKIGTIHPKRYEGEFGGKKCLLIHEPDMLDALVQSGVYDVIIYGHTHRAEITRRGKTLVINPGEGGGWITGRATAALLETETMEAELVEL
ncbi:MAG: metallophosphoesterase [PVC group bacterium]